MKFEIKKGVERPSNIVVRNVPLKYPVDKMEVDDSFEVPKEAYFPEGVEFDAEKYDGKKHRERVNNAVRGWALKQNTKATEEPQFNPETFKPIRFTVALLDSGNVGVWRDQ